MTQQAGFDLHPKAPQPTRPTEGEWESRYFEGGAYPSGFEVGVKLEAPYGVRKHIALVYREADARLIVAAPQMLEVLYEVERYLNESAEVDDESSALLQSVGKALVVARLWCEGGEGCSDDAYPVPGSEFCTTCRPIHEPGYLLHKAGKCGPECGRCALEAAMKEQAGANDTEAARPVKTWDAYDLQPWLDETYTQSVNEEQAGG